MEENNLETNNNFKKQNSNWSIPIAIVIAGALIAGAIIFKGKSVAPIGNTGDQNEKVIIEPVGPQDHIFGNPDAKVKVIEYSDPQCPYCQQFHKVMKEVMEKVGKNGEVAWVYRHFWPVNAKLQNGQIYHPLAGPAIEASQCIAEIGGNDAFWKFINDIFADSSSQIAKIQNLTNTALASGVAKEPFEECLSSKKYEPKLEEFYKKGRDAGITGTPGSFVMGPEGTVSLNGAGYTAEDIITLIESVK